MMEIRIYQRGTLLEIIRYRRRRTRKVWVSHSEFGRSEVFHGPDCYVVTEVFRDFAFTEIELEDALAQGIRACLICGGE
jgi:hypothetical protein